MAEKTPLQRINDIIGEGTGITNDSDVKASQQPEEGAKGRGGLDKLEYDEERMSTEESEDEDSTDIEMPPEGDGNTNKKVPKRSGKPVFVRDEVMYCGKQVPISLAVINPKGTGPRDVMELRDEKWYEEILREEVRLAAFEPATKRDYWKEIRLEQDDDADRKGAERLMRVYMEATDSMKRKKGDLDEQKARYRLALKDGYVASEATFIAARFMTPRAWRGIPGVRPAADSSTANAEIARQRETEDIRRQEQVKAAKKNREKESMARWKQYQELELERARRRIRSLEAPLDPLKERQEAQEQENGTGPEEEAIGWKGAAPRNSLQGRGQSESGLYGVKDLGNMSRRERKEKKRRRPKRRRRYKYKYDSDGETEDESGSDDEYRSRSRGRRKEEEDEGAPPRMPEKLPFESQTKGRLGVSTFGGGAGRTAAARSVEDRFELLSSAATYHAIRPLYDHSSRRRHRTPSVFSTTRRIYPTDRLLAKGIGLLHSVPIICFAQERAKNILALDKYNNRNEEKEGRRAFSGRRTEDIFGMSEVLETVKRYERLAEARRVAKDSLEKLKSIKVAGNRVLDDEAAEAIIRPLWQVFERRDQDVVDLLELMAIINLRITVGPAEKGLEGGLVTAARNGLRRAIETSAYRGSIISVIEESGEAIRITEGRLTVPQEMTLYRQRYNRMDGGDKKKIKKERRTEGGRQWEDKGGSLRGQQGKRLGPGLGGARSMRTKNWEGYQRTNRPENTCRFGQDCFYINSPDPGVRCVRRHEGGRRERPRSRPRRERNEAGREPEERPREE